MMHSALRQIWLIGNPHGAVLQGMDGVLIRYRSSVYATVEPYWVMRATDWRILGIGHMSSDVGAGKIRVGHHAGNRADRRRTVLSRAACCQRVHHQEDDQESGDYATTPEASSLQAVDLRLTCYRPLV